MKMNAMKMICGTNSQMTLRSRPKNLARREIRVGYLRGRARSLRVRLSTYKWFKRDKMRPKVICMMPMMIENFIFIELVNEILFSESGQTGSKPNGYGVPLNMRSVWVLGSGFRVSAVVS